ncbi:MAG: hypothetical protein HWN80_04200 [Candidatus Lokiarchaeota archaeon]|nr:hypothetical protein [Candidatus Lokiarchaeota archaeon]
MHVIVLFGILLLIFLRIIGLIISIEFLRELKDLKFKILIIGWSVWIIAGFSALLIGIFETEPLREVFLLINNMTTSIAILYVLMGLYSYFQAISRKIIAIFSVLSILIPLVAFLMRIYSNIFNFSSGILFIIVFIYSFLPLRKTEVFKKELSIKSFYWYLIFVFTVYAFIIFYVIYLLQGYSFGFYSDEFNIPMFINYFLGIITNIVILIYSIHLEYDISKIQKNNLRDKYSHDLGNLVQVIYSAAILTNVDEDLNKEKTENSELIQKKCEEAAKLIKDIKKT